MRIDVVTLFPRMFEGVFSESLLGKAREKGLVDVRVHDLRSFSDDPRRGVDDRPYGGGPGMVLRAEPLYRALYALGARRKARHVSKSAPWVIYLSPQGSPLNQSLAAALARRPRLILVCGRYEGIDERVFPWIDQEISVGDVVLTGGEIPAMALVDAVARTIPHVVKEPDSLIWDSFSQGWKGQLDCPHYTRPARWRGQAVPKVLLSGDHHAIAAWRSRQSEVATRKKRPDLYTPGNHIRASKPKK